jgi:hypothetical protein
MSPELVKRLSKPPALLIFRPLCWLKKGCCPSISTAIAPSLSSESSALVRPCYASIEPSNATFRLDLLVYSKCFLGDQLPR